jgi:hypothetical protein
MVEWRRGLRSREQCSELAAECRILRGALLEKRTALCERQFERVIRSVENAPPPFSRFPVRTPTSAEGIGGCDV